MQDLTRNGGCLLIGLFLTATQLCAQTNGLEQLQGQVWNPAFSPSQPYLVAFEAHDFTTKQLVLYNVQDQSIQQITALVQEMEDNNPFGDLLNQTDRGPETLTETNLAWRPVRDRKKRQWFAFISSGSAQNPDVYLSYVDVNGQLSIQPPLQFPRNGVEVQLAWSPDGNRLVVAGESDGNSDLFILENVQRAIDSGNPREASFRRLTNNPLQDEQPAWSPDGKTIAYQSVVRQGDKTNYAVSVLVGWENGMVKPIILTGEEMAGYHEYKPRWSPDGLLLAFYVSQSTTDQGDADDVNRLQDIGVLAVVRDGKGSISAGEILNGTSTRLAENVIPSTNGPAWYPPEAGQPAQRLLYVRRDEDRFNPIFYADIEAWQNKAPNFEHVTSDMFQTRLHRDPVVQLLPDGSFAYAFVSQVGTSNKIQVRPNPLPMIFEPESTGSALFPRIMIPGLYQIRTGRSIKGLALALGTVGALGAFLGFESSVRSEKTRLEQFAAARAVNDPAWQASWDKANSHADKRDLALGVAVGLVVVNLLDALILGDDSQSAYAQPGFSRPSLRLQYQDQGPIIRLHSSIKF